MDEAVLALRNLARQCSDSSAMEALTRHLFAVLGGEQAFVAVGMAKVWPPAFPVHWGLLMARPCGQEDVQVKCPCVKTQKHWQARVGGAISVLCFFKCMRYCMHSGKQTRGKYTKMLIMSSDFL